MKYLKEKINELETNSKIDNITGPYRCKKKTNLRRITGLGENGELLEYFYC
jgi:hypothetical protein